MEFVMTDRNLTPGNVFSLVRKRSRFFTLFIKNKYMTSYDNCKGLFNYCELIFISLLIGLNAII